VASGKTTSLAPAAGAPFKPSADNKRVIAYSYYGPDNPRYTDGLLDNAKNLETLFPGWNMWIYYDSSSSMARMKEAQALSPHGMVELIDTAPFGVKNRM
jgi:hypothetical protein